jgi:hypothetical protein
MCFYSRIFFVGHYMTLYININTGADFMKIDIQFLNITKEANTCGTVCPT